ncbi:restriction endonuclease [Buchananella hordeovulneris]|nr:restriction endonuclease [Buchananella hordeovulneris]
MGVSANCCLPDAELHAVAAAVLLGDPTGSRTAQVLRETFDQLYNGQHTGRWRLEQLYKTEKTHFGTLVEINMQRAFQFTDGQTLDFQIAGVEVDCKFSHTGGWMLPQECFEHLVLVLQADDATARWSMGLVRVTAAHRRAGANRDQKTSLNRQGRAHIHWLFRDAQFPANALLQLPSATVDAIMALPSGQARVNALLRAAVNLPLTGAVIATVAQQKDYMKRLRDNGGARESLRPEGYLILGGDREEQRQLAAALQLPPPPHGGVISTRVVPAPDGVPIGAQRWRLAAPGEPAPVPAPELPQRRR